MNKKKTILLIVAGIIIISLVIFIIIIKTNKVKVDNSIDGVSSVKTNDVVKEQIVGNLKFSGVSLLVIEGETNFYVRVTNTGQDYQIDNLYINFSGDNLDYKVLGLTNMELKQGESVDVRLTIDDDLSATKSVKYLLENAN